MILIRQASVWGPSGIETGDVLVDDGRVARVGDIDDGSGMTVIDAKGALLGPGFVDLHAHLREPGQTWKEDISSGSASAAAGGFTSVVVMPNTSPAIDTPKVVAQIREKSSEVGLVDIVVSGALTMGRDGLEPADFDALYAAGVRIFTDDGDSVQSRELMAGIMTDLARRPGALVADHAEDTSLTAGGHMNEGAISATLGIRGMPCRAEDVIVERDIGLAAETGCHLHVQHVSTATSVELVRQAKRSGLRVTAEVTPHHLVLDETVLQVPDPNLKMYPPLRTPDDRAALVEGLEDGIIDAVATDHAPHSAEEKSVPFRDAPRGVIGLETAAALTWAAVGRDPDLLFTRLSSAPARIAGLERHGHPIEPGSPANLVLFDGGKEWVPAGFRSKGSNSPFLGSTLRGMVTATIHNGHVVYRGDVASG